MKDELHKNQLSLVHLTAISIAGILPIIAPIEISPFIEDTGPAAIWPIILGYILFLLVSLPILEYTRLVPFAGGYYGLAELGFGKAVGKYTALANYMFYIFWQSANFFFIGWLLIDTVYLTSGVLLPYYIWVIAGTMALLVTFLFTIFPVRRLGNVITFAIILGLMVVIAFSIGVIVRSPYNSVIYYLNPFNSTSGWTGIFLATAVVGFFTFTGYGSPLFYTEETKESKRVAWIAIYLSLTISALVIALTAYSELISLPLSELSSITSSPLPELVAWSKYFPISALLALNYIILVISILAFAGGSGAQARLLWAMARDNFINVNWFKKLDSRKVPRNSALFNFLISLAVSIIIAFAMIKFYGYNPNTVATSWYAVATASSILWYFHHFVPEFGLFGFLRKHKEVRFSIVRKYVSGLIVPIGGMALFLYTFYQGIISDLVEPYFAFVIVSAILLIGDLIYVLIKKRKGQLGESVVEYMLAESGKLS